MYSADLLDDPEGTARAYCAAVGIAFDAAALTWEPGDRREVSWYGEGSGPWHDTLRASSGIAEADDELPTAGGEPTPAGDVRALRPAVRGSAARTRSTRSQRAT